MKSLAFLPLLISTITINANAQTNKQKDVNAIKQMCGCYEVTFDFAETFNYSKDSTYIASSVKHNTGLEWVQLVEDSDDKIMIQHLLIVGPPKKQRVIKHWRQDWIYENTEFYMYHYDNSWKYKKLKPNEVKGQWTQKVYQVDDSPRYEGSATWVHVDGKSYWENTTDAPLPRREYTKRSDYNVTVRTNRHEITEAGWIHDQDNLKVVRNESKSDFTLAKEKGLNTYTKVSDHRCIAANEWWAKNEATWALVRNKWDYIFSEKRDLTLERSIDGKPLFQHLFAKDFDNSPSNINKTIDAFVTK